MYLFLSSKPPAFRSEAIGNKGGVPYQKGNVKAHNLPQGIRFQRPYAYGQKQRSMIMEAKDALRFEVVDNFDLPKVNSLVLTILTRMLQQKVFMCFQRL